MTDTPNTPDANTSEAEPHNPYWAEIIAQHAHVICPSTKIDGWSGAHQKRFLEAIADGGTVRDACKLVRLSPQSAYAFRRKPKGRAFDLGWKAADLLAREKVAADILVRALDGQEHTTTREDGSTVTRHSYDNRLALTMLARLDRYADASENTAPGHAARMVAGDFDAYLDLVGAEGGPARAGLFMLARNADGEAPAAELEPIVALARADRQIRCGTLATDIDVADLDPARRAEWTGEQWARAEAAGLIALSPPPAPDPQPQSQSRSQPLPQPSTPADEQAFDCQPVSTSAPGPDWNDPVWFDEERDQWRTHFPPPAGFDGDQDGAWSDLDYERDLSAEEMTMLGYTGRDSDEELAARTAERDAWFAAYVRLDKRSEEESPERKAERDAYWAEYWSMEPAGKQAEDGEEHRAEHAAAPLVVPAQASQNGDSHGLQDA